MPLIFGAWLVAGCADAGGLGVDSRENAESSDGIDTAPSDTGPVAPTCDPVSLTLTQDLRPETMPNHASDSRQQPGVGLGDLDGDGDLDALVAWAGGSFGMRNDGAGNLAIDATITLEGSASGWPSGVSVALADLDEDGDLDAFLGEYDGGDRIVWNDGAARFTSQRLSEGEPTYSPWTGAWGDLDGDGDLDLYVARRQSDIQFDLVIAGTETGPGNYVYVNEGAGVFTRDDGRIPQAANYGITFQAAWVDVEGDGDLDVYEGNDWGYHVVPNRLLRNDGAGYFTEDDTCSCDVPMYSMGVAVGDANADERPDIVVTDIGSPRSFLNLDGAGFADASQAWNAYVPPSETNLVSWGASFLDFDRNGCSDLVFMYGRLGEASDAIFENGLPGVETGTEDPVLQSNVLLLNDCAPSFTRVEGTDFDRFPDRDRSVAVGDLDRDGRADLVSAGRDFLRVWMAGGGCEHGVTVRLAGAGENPAGIGARVKVEAGGRTQVQWMLPSTTSSSSAAELYFGFGDATAGEVSVVWPDGTASAVSATSGEMVEVDQ